MTPALTALYILAIAVTSIAVLLGIAVVIGLAREADESRKHKGLVKRIAAYSRVRS